MTRPGVESARARRRRWLFRLGRLGLGALTLALLTVPALSYQHVRQQVLLGRQLPSSVPPAPAADLARYAAFADHGQRTFVVLGYHDLANPKAQVASARGGQTHTVAVNRFAQQLRMLADASFHTVSAPQVEDYLHGRGQLPPHAALITFNGGRTRDWTYADKLLARYGFRAVVFVDPARVGDDGYLSWTRLRTMAHSGRWSVEAGAPDPGATVTTDTAGHRQSAWLSHAVPARGKAETTAGFQARIAQTLRRSRDAMVANGLPDPRLFSYPFQPGYPLKRVQDNFNELTQVVDGQFVGGVLSLAPDEAVTGRWVAQRLLPRIDVYDSTTEQILFARISQGSTS